jgi:hypothetical protein
LPISIHFVFEIGASLPPRYPLKLKWYRKLAIMKVLNIHERQFSVAPDITGTLINTLSAKEDKLWPVELWVAMRLDKGLRIGSRGGHGPIRYFIKEYEPGRKLVFQFTCPTGFNGCHYFQALIGSEAGTSILRHVIDMDATGSALLTWPLIFRPLHDALIEDALDKAQNNLGLGDNKTAWSFWVKFLRWLLQKI